MKQKRKTVTMTEEQSSPSFLRSKTGGLTLIFSALLLISAAVGLLSGPQLQAATAEKAPPPARAATAVETIEVRVADSERQLSAVGSLRSEESVVIATEIAGRLEEIGFMEGAQVTKGQLLIRLESSIQQAELDRAIASRDLSLNNNQRAENLLQDRAIGQQERDEAFAQWKLNEANVRLVTAQLEKTRIRAPFSGTIGLRQVSPGDYLQPGQPLVNLEAIEQLKVEFTLPERYVTEVSVGQQLEFQSEAYKGRIFTAQVYAINPLVALESRGLVVRARFDNSARLLLPGQFVKVQLNVATTRNALFVPEQALIPQPKTTLVFKVVDGKAEMVTVETGSRIKGWVEITKGLAAGDVVVTGGHQKIGPGSPVNPKPADPALFSKI